MNINKNRLGYFFEIALFLVILLLVIIRPPSYSDIYRCGCFGPCPPKLNNLAIFFRIMDYYSDQIVYLRYDLMNKIFNFF